MIAAASLSAWATDMAVLLVAAGLSLAGAVANRRRRDDRRFDMWFGPSAHGPRKWESPVGQDRANPKRPTEGAER